MKILELNDVFGLMGILLNGRVFMGEKMLNRDTVFIQMSAIN